ncbi:MAG: hypothetical protein KBA86_00020 [Bacteroidales bacterium]|nr:hypothetical protein [Bacteroidales bacterium]
MYFKVLILIILSVFINKCFPQINSINNRWTINSNYSLYPIYETTMPFIESTNNQNLNTQRHKLRSNFRLNVNYGVLYCLEVGTYIGFMHYPVEKVISSYHIAVDSLHYMIGLNTEELQKLAPTFGININLHILPFIKTDTKFKWDLYVSAKYGGCYFISYKNGYSIPISSHYYKDELIPYRHEYGLGIGGSVFFWNLVGFNTELSVGQYSYWPNIFSSNFNFRAGIIFKLNTNQKKIKI